MRATFVTNTTTAKSTPVVLDQYLPVYAVGLRIVCTNGGGGGSSSDVEVCYDDPWATYATDYGTNASWAPVTGLTGIASTTQGNLSSDRSVRAVRLNTTAISGAGSSAKMTVVQQGLA